MPDRCEGAILGQLDDPVSERLGTTVRMLEQHASATDVHARNRLGLDDVDDHLDWLARREILGGHTHFLIRDVLSEIVHPEAVRASTALEVGHLLNDVVGR